MTHEGVYSPEDSWIYLGERSVWQMGFGHNRQAVGGVFHPGHGHGFLFIDQIATPA